jgi:hypothetical protein
MCVSASTNDRRSPVSVLVIAAGMLILWTTAAPYATAADSGDGARRPTLKSIALSPQTFAGFPGATLQLTVTGTFSNGAIRTLRPAAQAYASSNAAIATVSTAGVVSVAAGATVGSTATIGARNRETGISTSASSSSVVTVIAPTLVSIALAPLAVQLAPNASQQLTVTGTYNNGSTQALPASGELFISSNQAIATVSTTGLVTVVPGAVVGDTSTIGVTDAASGISAAPGQSTVVTATLPSTNSINAATETANDNSLCNNAIAPFYWEIGDQNGALASGSVGTDNGLPISGSTEYSIASASKMLYAAYVTQVRGSASNLTPTDINFLTLMSGYTNMPETTTQGSVCPATDSPDTVNVCLTLKSAQTQYPNEPFSYLVTADVGYFYYNSGHMEVHAQQYMALGPIPVEPLGSAGPSLGTVFATELVADAPFNYSEPLMSGGIATTADVYAGVLRSVLNGSLALRDALGIDPVCTLNTMTDCPNMAHYTPLPQEAWHYSIGHWVEDNPEINGDPATKGDGAFSSSGEFGFYPWIDSTKSYYGIISHYQPGSAYSTIQCGRLIRAAFMTGVPQTDSLPTH